MWIFKIHKHAAGFQWCHLKWPYTRNWFVCHNFLKQWCQYIEIKLVNCKVNSVQEACAKCFAIHIPIKVWNLAYDMKKLNKKHIVFCFSSISLAFWCFLFCYFMWFGRFQILISEPQSILRKLLVLLRDHWIKSWWSLTPNYLHLIFPILQLEISSLMNCFFS